MYTHAPTSNLQSVWRCVVSFSAPAAFSPSFRPRACQNGGLFVGFLKTRAFCTGMNIQRMLVWVWCLTSHYLLWHAQVAAAFVCRQTSRFLRDDDRSLRWNTHFAFHARKQDEVVCTPGGRQGHLDSLVFISGEAFFFRPWKSSLSIPGPIGALKLDSIPLSTVVRIPEIVFFITSILQTDLMNECGTKLGLLSQILFFESWLPQLNGTIHPSKVVSISVCLLNMMLKRKNSNNGGNFSDLRWHNFVVAKYFRPPVRLRLQVIPRCHSFRCLVDWRRPENPSTV